MALELTKRKIREGMKVGLFCFNKKLGVKLSASLTTIDDSHTSDSYANTLHKYLISHTSDGLQGQSDKSSFYQEELPIEFLVQNQNLKYSEKFDVLIIDEAQDLLTEYYLEIFDWILKDGIKEGNWVMFGDFTNQAIYLNEPDKAKKRLKEKCFFSELPPLRINCRNTKRIANHNTLLTGVKLPRFTGKTITGESIGTKFPANSKKSNLVIKIVRDLLGEGFEKSQITLLSPIKFDNTYLAESEYINNLRNEGLEATTIHSYKGLENVVVILFGFNGIQTEKAQRLFYVGVSRATQRLYLVLDNSLEHDYQQIVRDNLSKIKCYGY
jgi:superfamily I DNA/RNA helicase